MELQPIEKLARLSANEALGRRTGELAARRLGIAARLAVAFNAILLLASLDSGMPARMLAGAMLVLVLLLLLGTLRSALRGPGAILQAAIAAQPRGSAILFLVVHYGLLWAFTYLADGEPVLAFAYPAFVLLFRLPLPELLLSHGALLALTYTAGLALGAPSGEGHLVATLVGSGVMNILFLGLGAAASRRFRRRFQREWSAARQRWDEERRLRQELDYAREMQLAMLPQRGPDVSWLETASLSLPATEVGGDYYDYFVLPDGRVAVVVADVAGHGMASGMVLSGVRSCLLLLAEELEHPARVLERLHGMLRRDSAGRHLVSLSLLVIGPAGDATLAIAAAPPPFLYRHRSGEVSEIETSSLPLGAGLATGFDSRSVDVEPGDLLLLLTDGAYEMVNADDEAYGMDRLQRRFASAATEDPSPTRVRDALLHDLWTFKGDVPQQDDITLVVLRLQTPS